MGRDEVIRPGVSDVTWNALKRLPEWALFHPDLEDAWEAVAAGHRDTGDGLLQARVCAELEYRDRLRSLYADELS